MAAYLDYWEGLVSAARIGRGRGPGGRDGQGKGQEREEEEEEETAGWSKLLYLKDWHFVRCIIITIAARLNHELKDSTYFTSAWNWLALQQGHCC